MRATPTSHVDSIELALALPPQAIALDPIAAPVGDPRRRRALSRPTTIRVDEALSGPR